MVQEGIVLGHLVSTKGIEVDKVKIQLIEKLSLPTLMKEIRSFLEHLGFYRLSSRTSLPLCTLLEKDVPFNFYECLVAFNTLKKKLVIVPILAVHEQNLPFELMCGVSDYRIGVVLGQHKNKVLHVIHYDGKTLIETQLNYATTKKRAFGNGVYL